MNKRMVPRDNEIIEKYSENVLLESENKFLKEMLAEKIGVMARKTLKMNFYTNN